uniref:Uncharacterized protein n=1 Tax=Anguilla anguilla TaxID=7936 RepID=A0A0E9VGU8_ANGAN
MVMCSVPSVYFFSLVSAHFPLAFQFLPPLSAPPSFLSFSVCPHSGKRTTVCRGGEVNILAKDTE